MNRSEKIAQSIAQTYGIHVKYVGGNLREYIVETVGFSTAEKARAYAKKLAETRAYIEGCGGDAILDRGVS